MRITSVEPLLLAGQGEQGAYGAPYGFLVRVGTDAGIVGYGEADTMPAVAKAVIEAPFVHESMSGLKWRLLGEDPMDIERLWQRMADATLSYSRDGATLHAMAAIDLALWDIKGKVMGRPVCELLGGARRTALQCYATHPLGATLAETTRFASTLRSAGFGAVKFGWHPLGADGDADEAIVRCLRQAIGDDAELLIDAGLAWDVETSLERLRRFRPYRLFWLEEPLRPYDFADYTKLAAAAETPIAAGEMASGAAELDRLIEGRCVDVLQVDIARIGLTEAMGIASRAARAGIPCVNHTYGYGIALAASLHFLAAIERASLCEYQATPNEIRDVLIRDAPRPASGVLRVPEGPGLGVSVDDDALHRFLVAG